MDDSTLQCKLQVGGLGDVYRVELKTSQPPPLPPPRVGDRLIPDQSNEDNLQGHLREDNPQGQDHPSKDSLSINDNPVLPVHVNNKRKNDTEVMKDRKRITIKPPTRQQMKITRRRNSVVAAPPDKNQRKITSMFGPPQKMMKVENITVKSDVNEEKSNDLSEPKLKRSRISGNDRVSDIKNDIHINNPDLGESENQEILTKSLEEELMTK